MCNEAFDGVSFAETCRAIRRAGYAGIEIAPFTLAESPRSIAPEARREYRDIMRSEGLDFVGFHWLMAAPKGLHVTTPDAEVRSRSWQHLRDLIDLAAELGDGAALVFGSPRQRCAAGGLTPQEAAKNLVDGFASIGGHACSRGVNVLVEALSPDQCDVVQTLAEAVEVVRQVGNPAIQTMFDVHNAVAETEPHAALVDRYYEYIRHVHVNELDGRHCGAGDYDYAPVLDVLRRRRYPGWISLEAFDFTPGAERLANESLRHLEREIARLPL
jgi:sugar phosphate isomerase/epimerase